MAEAIISRRGYTAEGKPELRTETITGSTNWTVPKGIKGDISVLIFGGGGGGHKTFHGGGGGGGWMNNGTVSIPGGTNVKITIGTGGAVNTSGGTTSFGTYLSANGGRPAALGTGAGSDGGDGGSGGGACENQGIGGRGYQFGGGGGGGDSGSWLANGHGGDGGTYGGGGAGGGWSIYVGSTLIPDTSTGSFSNGGNGGMYGGGGYGPLHGGKGGTYGGNGGSGANIPYSSYGSLAVNGTNTIGIEEVSNDCRGEGKAGSGYIKEYFIDRNSIKNDGINSTINSFKNMTTQRGGGGGYGGNGGKSLFNGILKVFSNGIKTFDLHTLGGGGGGYGGNGGSGVSDQYGTIYGGGGGGGGGYGRGADGGNAIRDAGGGGGGGYFSKGGDGDSNGGGGGGGYGDGGNSTKSAGYGAGGGNSKSGGGGICILQYYL